VYAKKKREKNYEVECELSWTVSFVNVVDFGRYRIVVASVIIRKEEVNSVGTITVDIK
jgi:hypothetical protein